MSKRLKENLSSDYFSAANRLKPANARRRIVAYVESYDDVYFWRSVLSRFEDDKCYFEVMLPSRMTHLERGKKAAVMSLVGDRVGRDMIACVDADYDYLMQGCTPFSQKIISSPYIFHTYAYAIENFQCYAPSLHDVCVAATLNDSIDFDFEAYFREYSLAIFPLFVWSIWAYRTSNYSDFSITDFLSTIEPGRFTLEGYGDHLRRLRRRVGQRVARLQKQYPKVKEQWLQVKEDVKRLGVTPETTYLFIQGHHLFEKVVVPMLRRICNILMHRREMEIARQSLHAIQRRNELSCYESSVSDVQLLLKKNNEFLASPLFRLLADDVRRFLHPDAPEQSISHGSEQKDGE